MRKASEKSKFGFQLSSRGQQTEQLLSSWFQTAWQDPFGVGKSKDKEIMKKNIKVKI